MASSSSQTLHRFVVAGSLCAALVGCTEGGAPPPQSGGQTGGEPAGCLPVETQQLSLDERSPLGFSGADALIAIAASWTRPFVWAEGGETELTVTIGYTGDDEVAWQDREWTSPAEVSHADLGECVDVLAIAISVDFSTADGSFAETWSGVALAETATYATHTHELDLTALHGSYQVPEAAQYDEVDGFVAMTFDDGWVSGIFEAFGTRLHGAGDEAAVEGTAIETATF